MKNITKIMIVAICVVLLSALAVIAISADSAIETDATLSELYVSTGGSVDMHFVYSDFGSATEIVVELYAPGAETPRTYKYDVATLTDNTVTVPLAPSQMDHTIKVYAQDANGKGVEKSCSVYSYASAILGMEAYTPYHNTMRTLLNWGAMADIYFTNKDLGEEETPITKSGINTEMFMSGTNPVAGVKTFAEATDGVVDGEAVKVAGYQVFLEPGNTTMRLYFTYAGAASDLSATIAKEGVVVAQGQAEAPVRADKEVENLYYVNINNVGVAVFDKAYTVTVKAGEDSASVTKTVLEYLNTIAFNTENYTEDQNDLAKSMYQFYVCAMGKKVADCAHETTHQIYENGVFLNACSTCFAELATHNDIVAGQTANEDGTITYTYTCNCAECDGAIVYRKTLKNVVSHANITTATSTIVATGETAADRKTVPVFTTMDENGMVYTHVEAAGRQVETVITLENVPAGMVMYVKYQLNDGNTPEGWIHTNVTVTTADGTSHLMSDGTVENEDLVKHHDGWVTGRANVKGNFSREGVTSGATVKALTLTFVHSDNLDITYFVTEPTEDNVNAMPYVYSMGDDYYMHWDTVIGSFRADEWRKMNDSHTGGTKQTDPADGFFNPPATTRAPLYVEEIAAPEEPEEVGHQLTLKTEPVDENNTRYYYTCACADCAGKEYQSVTLNNAAISMDITKITSTGTVSTVIENGKAYQHIATNGAEVTTTIKVENARMAMALFMKYRLNGTAVPTAGIKAGITYVVDGKSFYVNTTDISAATLATYHQDWVIGRVNMMSTFKSTTAGKAYINSDNSFSATATSMTITITHSQDLDVEFVYGDTYENNKYVFPVLYATGNKYYLVQTVFGAHSGTSRWRQIFYSNGTYSAPSSNTGVTDSNLGSYKTPYLKDAAK